MTSQTVSAQQHRDALEELMGFMRDRGLQRYRGPVFGEGWRLDEVELNLGDAPRPPAVEAAPAKVEPLEPPKRHADGLTTEEQVALYNHSFER